jgi:serine/threonine protein kinase
VFAAKVYGQETHGSLTTLPELRAIRSILHPNVILCYDAFVENDHVILVYEYCCGGSLADEIAAHPKGIPIERFKYIARQIIGAVAAIHDRGFSHQAIKASNVLFSDEARQTVKLTDFGVVDRAGRSGIGHRAGAYQCPEIWQGRPYDARLADVWSLGVLFAWALQGETPWTGAFCLDDLQRRITSFDADIMCDDAAILGIVRRMLSPQETRPSVAELLRHPVFGGEPKKIRYASSGPIPGISDASSSLSSSLLVALPTSQGRRRGPGDGSLTDDR